MEPLKKQVGEFVNPKSIPSIMEGIERIITSYDNYVIDQVDFSPFDWKSIGSQYLKIYENVLAEK